MHRSPFLRPSREGPEHADFPCLCAAGNCVKRISSPESVPQKAKLGIVAVFCGEHLDLYNQARHIWAPSPHPDPLAPLLHRLARDGIVVQVGCRGGLVRFYLFLRCGNDKQRVLSLVPNIRRCMTLKVGGPSPQPCCVPPLLHPFVVKASTRLLSTCSPLLDGSAPCSCLPGRLLPALSSRLAADGFKHRIRRPHMGQTALRVSWTHSDQVRAWQGRGRACEREGLKGRPSQGGGELTCGRLPLALQGTTSSRTA